MLNRRGTPLLNAHRLIFACVCLVAFVLGDVSIAKTARLITPLSPPPAPVETGMRILQRVLVAQGWDVETAQGPEAAAANAPALEIVISPFNEQLFPAEQVNSIGEVVDSAPESFHVMRFEREGGARMYAIGSDDVGALYAALDLADQFETHAESGDGASRIQERRATTSALSRGIAASIPRQALEDAFSWFHSEAYWSGFFERIARSRFNRLALRGVTDAKQGPSDLLPYFYSNGQVGEDIAQRNRTSLNRIIDIGRTYGVRITLETFIAPGGRSPAQLKEMVSAFLKATPNLAGLGFAPGPDTPQARETYVLFLEGMIDAGVKIPLTISTRDADFNLAQALTRAYPNGTVAHVALNAVELGLSFISPNANSTWNYIAPPRRYSLLFHIQPYELHQLTPWADVRQMQRVMKAAQFNGANGFLIEIEAPFAPHSVPDAKTAPPDLRYAQWMHDRDWFAYEIWGKLGYNPDEEETVFVQAFQRRFGAQAGGILYQAAQKASSVLPALRKLLPPSYSAAQSMPLAMAPPPSIAQWLEHSGANSFAARSINEEVETLASKRIDGRAAPRTELVQALQTAHEAVKLIGDAGRLLNPQSKQTEGLLSDIEIRRYQEWRSWQLDFELTARLAQCWLDQLDAAVQYGLYGLTGDAAALVVATEKNTSAETAWRDLQAFTQKHYRFVPVPGLDGLREDHWSEHNGPFKADREMIAQRFTQWSEATTWNGVLGHWAVRRTAPHEPFLATVSFPPKAGLDGVNLAYRNSAGVSRQLTMEPTRVSGVYYAQVPSDLVVAGGIQYYFVGTVSGKPFESNNPATGKPYITAVSHDDQPPKLNYLRHSVNVEKTRVTVIADLLDLMGIAEAALLWRPAAGSSDWLRVAMDRDDPQFSASFLLTGAGALYAVEVIDVLGNARRYPASPDAPYNMIEPFVE